MVVGLKGHPALVDLARPRDVPQHLLHVDVLVPAASGDDALRNTAVLRKEIAAAIW